jgi:hypothetical protein
VFGSRNSKDDLFFQHRKCFEQVLSDVFDRQLPDFVFSSGCEQDVDTTCLGIELRYVVDSVDFFHLVDLVLLFLLYIQDKLEWNTEVIARAKQRCSQVNAKVSFGVVPSILNCFS